jgi:hypothetical protein
VKSVDAYSRMDKQGNLLSKYNRKGYFWRKTVIGILISGLTYIFSFVVLGLFGFTYDSRPGIPIIGNYSALLIFKIVLIVLPFTVGALYFRTAFRLRKHRVIETLTAMLLIWLTEKVAILAISSMIYSIGIWDLPRLMFRISHGGDQSAPWFTVDYIFFSFIGCMIFGLLASKRKKPGYNA